MRFLAWLVVVAGVCLITWPCPLFTLNEPYLSWYMETVLRVPAGSTAALPFVWLCYSVPAGVGLIGFGAFAMERLQKRSQAYTKGISIGGKAKWLRFNVNDTVRVRLTAHGRELHRRQQREFWERMGRPAPEYLPPKEDADGWSRWQMWVLMRDFGQHLAMGAPMPWEPTIEIEATTRGS